MNNFLNNQFKRVQESTKKAFDFKTSPVATPTPDQQADINQKTAELRKAFTENNPQEALDLVNIISNNYFYQKDSIVARYSSNYETFADLQKAVAELKPANRFQSPWGKKENNPESSLKNIENITFDTASHTEKGLTHTQSDDRVYTGKNTVIVCDGISQGDTGFEAAQKVVDLMGKYIDDLPTNTSEEEVKRLIQEKLNEIDSALITPDIGKTRFKYGGKKYYSGTTMILFKALDNGRFVTASVGDSYSFIYDEKGKLVLENKLTDPIHSHIGGNSTKKPQIEFADSASSKKLIDKNFRIINLSDWIDDEKDVGVDNIKRVIAEAISKNPNITASELNEILKKQINRGDDSSIAIMRMEAKASYGNFPDNTPISKEQKEEIEKLKNAIEECLNNPTKWNFKELKQEVDNNIWLDERSLIVICNDLIKQGYVITINVRDVGPVIFTRFSLSNNGDDTEGYNEDNKKQMVNKNLLTAGHTAITIEKVVAPSLPDTLTADEQIIVNEIADHKFDINGTEVQPTPDEAKEIYKKIEILKPPNPFKDSSGKIDMAKIALSYSNYVFETSSLFPNDFTDLDDWLPTNTNPLYT
jgi:hypothetical protein